MAAANRVGDEPTMHFAGDSLLVGPSAEVYAVLDEPIEGYAVATIRPRRSAPRSARIAS